MLDLEDFAFDAAVVVAAFRWTPADATECGEELAVAFFRGAIFAVDLFLDEAEAAGFAVFLAAETDEVVVAPAAAEDCASKLIPGHSRQDETTATRIKVLLSCMTLHSNYPLPIASRGRYRPAPQLIKAYIQL
jgi:hypothetical protein